VHHIVHIKCSPLGVHTTKYLKRDTNYGHFASKWTNDRVLRVVGLVSTLTTARSMFYAYNAVIWEFKRRSMSIGMAIVVISREYRRVIAFRELLGLFSRVIQRAQCSASKKQSFGHLKVEVSRSGRKLRSFVVQIDVRTRFATLWYCFNA
jgi:hypothetical protein